MTFEIKNLTLYQDLLFTEDQETAIMRTEELSIFTNRVSMKDMNPDRKCFLTDEEWCGYGLEPGARLKEGKTPEGIIPAGKYLFVQFFLGNNEKDEKKEMCGKAAEALFLEASWQEIPLKDRVYLRTLIEGDKKVCQLFREIEGKKE
ncbi:MAG: hypothetical protein K5930_10415 [Treponemataceae bacterium]|nr:hypothetical protein [Treponemataceae bacterium]